VLNRKAPAGIIKRTDTGKPDGRFRKTMIFLPRRSTNMNMKRLKTKLIITDRPTRLIDSLSDFGKTIASSNLKDDITIIIPTRLRYTEYIPKDSGENNLLRIG